jgi:prolyl-tRNA editing enzyme YbaK/EbsC (Cys-tRNA(Pro) deacylase)
MAGRPKGSENKDKPFREALRMELAAAGRNHKQLRSIAKALLAKAETGDVVAIKEVADRLDGKAPQAVIGDAENPINLIHRIERVIVDSSNPDS